MKKEITFFNNPNPVATGIEPQKASGMSIQLEVITPDIAQHLLDGNTDNRPAKPRHVKFLADQMRAGAWKVTGDPVKIATSGRLLDGQHRLIAIVESGTTQHVYVARNCEEEIFSVLDTGRNRSAGDVLAIAGMKNANNLAAAAKLLYLYDNDMLASMGHKLKVATHQALLDYVQGRDLDSFVTQGLTWYTRCRMLAAAEWVVLYYLLAQKDSKKGLDFMQQIATGLNLTEGHPVYLLRTKLAAAREGRFNFTAAERMALTIKAWNALRESKKIGMLTWRMSEGFPVIV